MSLTLLFHKGYTDLLGSVSVSSSVTGTVEVSRELVGSVSSVSTISGAAEVSRYLGGSVSATSALIANLWKLEALAGPIIATTTFEATISRQRGISGTIATSSTLSAAITCSYSLYGAVSASSSISGLLGVELTIAGAVSATSSVSGTLSKALCLVGSISVSTSLSAYLGNTRQLVGTITVVSSVSGHLSFPSPATAFYYAKLGSTILTGIEKDSFRITEELNKIPSFEFEIANCSDNRTAIAAGIADIFRIYRRYSDVDTLMFTGIINGDAIEYLSLERIRITGYASYIDLNWRFHQHLTSEDAENVDKVVVHSSTLEDFTTFTEVDIASDRIQKTTRHVDHYACRGEATYLYKDYGVGHFGDFTHKIKFRAETLPTMNYGAFYVLSDTIGDLGCDGMMEKSILLYPLGTTLWLKEFYNWGDHSDSMLNLSTNTWYYLKLEKSGAALSVKIYSDPEYSTLLDTLSLTLQTNHTFRYLYACNTMNSNSNYCANHDIDNFCLTTDTEYVDYTTQSNSDTINDVPITYGNVNDTLYVGQDEQFFGMQVKYSTKGVQAASTTVVWEYSKGSSVWATLDVLDETRAFTEDTGTYFITIPHKPSDWAKEGEGTSKKFWIRARLSAGSYSTQPKLDRIKITNIDVYRVYYFETAANSIMGNVLEGTGYSMDAIDTCPSDTISIVAEYETKLRIIAGVANALTWDDSSDKKAYQWWIDTSKKVHFKQKRGATLGDITGELTILNNVEDYFNLSNRLHFFGNYDGLNQLRAVIENTDSQDTHEIREIAVPEERYNNYLALKAAAQKAMTYTKAPLQKIAATVTTRYWVDNAFEVGDTVTLRQDTWNVDETAFQIVRADIGPRITNIDMGISQEHLDGLKTGLQRQLDITGIRMHGSTTLLQFGPETMNYQRVDGTTVYPAHLKFEIPSDARYIHKILVSWKLGPYRAEVTGGVETEGHSHGGYSGAGGAFTPAVVDGGKHTPTELSKAHKHGALNGSITYTYTIRMGWLPTSPFVQYEKLHKHSNPSTGSDGAHVHPAPTCAAPAHSESYQIQACTDIGYGTPCAEGACVDVATTWYHWVSTREHKHIIGSISSAGAHTHPQGNTGVDTNPVGHRHHLVTSTGDEDPEPYMMGPFSLDLSLWKSDDEDPAHVHTINEVLAHPHTGVYEGTHNDHDITSVGAAAVDLTLGIVEVAGGTVMQLTVNGEDVTTIDGNGTDIVITGYCATGVNTVELAPITGSNVKGGCTTQGRGIVFIEAAKF